MLAFALFSTGLAAPRNNANPECNATKLFEYLEASALTVGQMMKGRHAMNETCNCDMYSASSGQFCYFQPTEGKYAATNGVQFCKTQTGDHTYAEMTSYPGYQCKCYDPKTTYMSSANMDATTCGMGQASRRVCANTDGTATNAAQLAKFTDAELQYYIANNSATVEKWNKCLCGNNECVIGGQQWGLGEFCVEEQHKCSAFKACALDTELTENCQCGSETCWPAKEHNPVMCSKYPAPADADYAKAMYNCESPQLYVQANDTVYILSIVPPFVLCTMIAVCLWYRWFLVSIAKKIGGSSKGSMQVEA